MPNLSFKNNSAGTQATLGLGVLEQVKFNADGSVEIPDLDNPELAGKLDTANAFGVGQTWQNVKASRALGVTYTNSTGKPIEVAVAVYAGGNHGLYITIDGVVLTANGTTNLNASLTATIPPGGTYSVTNLGTSPLIDSWAELRS